MPNLKLLLTHSDREVEVSLEPGPQGGERHCRVTIGERSLDLAIDPRPSGLHTVRHGTQVLPFAAAVEGEQVHVWLAGRVHRFTLPAPRAARRRAAAPGAIAPAGDLKAPMPGTILKTLVKPGDTVEAHQPIVVMESMKMEMTLNAPQAGVVAAVPCQVGQLVQMGALLVTFQPP